MIIAGMGRFGQVVNRMLTGLGHKTVVLDSHPETIERIRAFGVKGFYGDVGRPRAAGGRRDRRGPGGGAGDRRPREDDQDHRATIHRRYPEVKIIARARDRHHVYQLYAAGTPDSVREVFDSAVRAGKYALAALDYDEEEIEHIAEAFFEHDRHMLAELAELWDPEIPSSATPPTSPRRASRTPPSRRRCAPAAGAGRGGGIARHRGIPRGDAQPPSPSALALV